MASTTVNGNLKDAGFSNYALQTLYFRLKNAGTDSTATTVVARNSVSTTTDASGDFSIELWNNGQSDITSVYEVTLPGGERIDFIIPSANDGGTIEFDRLIALHQPDGSAQVATLGGVFQAIDAGLTDISGLAVTDGNIIVGDGTNWVAESGATARTSLGLGTIATEDSAAIGESFIPGITAGYNLGSPTKLWNEIHAFAIDLGASTNSTLTAAGSGELSIEGNIIYRAGGTDVPVTDGGTGASTASGARTNLGVFGAIVAVSTSTTLTTSYNQQVSQTASGITTTLWASAASGDQVTIHNYSGGDNTIAASAGIKSSSIGTDTSVTIFNDEVLKFIYDGTNWLLTT